MRLFISGLQSQTGGITPIYGCTDPSAENYNPLATHDDGSCTYGGFTDVESIMIIGTSNALSQNTYATSGTPADLPSDGFIANAYYVDYTYPNIGILPFEINMNIWTPDGYGLEYRIAKRLTEEYTNEFNLAKLGANSSSLVNGWNVVLDGDLIKRLEIAISGRAGSTGTPTLNFTKVLVVGWENDCVNSEYANAIETNFNTLISKIRNFNNVDANCKFYVLEMANFTSGTTPFRSTGVTQIQNVADADANVFIFKPTWLTPDSDNFIADGIHYKPEVYDLIANKFLEVAFGLDNPNHENQPPAQGTILDVVEQ